MIDPRNYVFDGDGRMMGEYGATVSDVKAETIWLSPEVDTPNQPLVGDDGVGGYAPLAVVTGGALYWVHGNHLGVPTVITDSAGAAAAPTGYTAVGFPGQTRTLADLYYNLYRDYDPTTGRYIQADPIGLEGGNNSYLYAAGNPVRWTDPMGLNPWLFRRAWVTGEVAGQALSWWCLRNIALCMRTIGPTAIRIAAACKAVNDALSGEGDEDPRDYCHKICVEESVGRGYGSDAPQRYRKCMRRCLRDRGIYDY